MVDRLSKEDWVSHGLNVLERDGHEFLKADLLVKELSVSRGSFYWHFSNLRDFHLALLAQWQTENTDSVLAQISQIPSGEGQVEALLTHCLETELKREAAMRRWAQINETVKIAVQEVDQIRFDFIYAIFHKLGFSDLDARSRAALLVWSYIGRSLATRFVEGLLPEAPRLGAKMLLANP